MGKCSAPCSDSQSLLSVQSQRCFLMLSGEPATLPALPISLLCIIQLQLLILSPSCMSWENVL